MKPKPSEAALAELLESNDARWAGIARAYALRSDRDVVGQFETVLCAEI